METIRTKLVTEAEFSVFHPKPQIPSVSLNPSATAGAPNLYHETVKKGMEPKDQAFEFVPASAFCEV